MATPRGFLPREGLTLEALFQPVKQTILQPVVTGGLLLGLLYYPERITDMLPVRYRHLAHSARFLFWLKAFFGLGLARTLNERLSQAVLNNWTADPWRTGEEIVLITGGCSGIGELLVHRMATSSRKVIALDLSPPKRTLPSNAAYYQLDVTKSEQIAAVASRIRAEHGEPTVLVNNAGIGAGRSILDESEVQIRRTFDVNVIAHFLMAKEFLPAMARANHGHVVTVASMASFAVIAQNVDYSCTKAGALAFHEGLAGELKSRYNAPKVRTTVVHPFWVRTPLIADLVKEPRFKAFVLEPETVVDAIEDNLLKARSGQIILPERMNGASGMRAWPHWMQQGARDLTDRQMAFAAEGRLA